MKIISNTIKGMLQFAAVALVVASVAMPQSASANTGAGATILNVVTVNYKDAAGVTSYAETAASTVTVNLVISAPTLTAPVDQTVASGSTATYTYTITSTANGSDTYQITTPIGTTTNATGATAVPSVTTITLGASVITAAPTASTIEIPAGSETNLAVNDIVVIGGNSYVITNVAAGTAATHTNPSGTDGVAGTTTPETPTVLTLGIDVAGSNVTPAFTAALVGTVVGEQATFTVDVTATAGPAPGDGTVPVTTTVATSGGTPLTTTDPIVTTFSGPALTITKEVSIDGGTTFAATAAGAPGDTLTYRITVTNSGTGSATSVVVTDPMPLYTTYTPGTAKSDTVAGTTYAAAATVLTDASDAPIDQYDFGVTTANTATLSVGTLAGGATSVLFYQVTID